jgi:DNA-directed RNA polymerase specialized sigma subunit
VSAQRNSADAWELSAKHDKLARKFVRRYLYGAIRSRQHRYFAPAWVHERDQGIDMVELRKDLHAVALIALQKAARFWKPSLRVSFETYSADPVGQALTEEIGKHRRVHQHMDENDKRLGFAPAERLKDDGISIDRGGRRPKSPHRLRAATSLRHSRE